MSSLRLTTAAALIGLMTCAGSAHADGRTIPGGGGGKDSAQAGGNTSAIISGNLGTSLPPAVPTPPTSSPVPGGRPQMTITLRRPSPGILGAADTRRIDVQRVQLEPPSGGDVPAGPDLGATEVDLRRALPMLPGTVVGAGNQLVLVYVDPTAPGTGGGYVLANPDGSVPQGLGAASNLGGNSPSVNGLLLSHGLR